MAKIAVFAQPGLELDALLEAWQASASLSAFQPYLIADEDVEETVLFQQRPLDFHAVTELGKQAISAAIVLDDAVDEAVLKKLTCPVIGRQRAASSLFHRQKSGILHLPEALVLLLNDLLAGAACQEFNATVFMPAAFYGQQAVQELASQTVSLLNAKAAKARLFKEQLSFNCFPFEDKDYGAQLLEQSKMLGLAQHCHFELIQAPVFHGMALSLSLSLSKEEAKSQQAHWKTLPYLHWAKEGGASLMSAVQLDGAVQIRLVEQALDDKIRLHLWLAFDDVRFFIQQGLISALEFLLKCD